MLLQFQKNPVTDYQQVTNDEILPEFQNKFPVAGLYRKEIEVAKIKV